MDGVVKVRRTMWRVSGSWESKAARVSASFAPLTGSNMSWMQPVQHQPMSPSLLALVPTSITLMQTGQTVPSYLSLKTGPQKAGKRHWCGGCVRSHREQT